MYLRYGSKKDGDYIATYFRYKDTNKIMHYMYFNDPVDAICWLFRHYLHIKPHCWGGGDVTGANDCISCFKILESGEIIQGRYMHVLHDNYLQKWKNKK